MVFKKKSNLNQIFQIIFLLLLTNISNLYSHNLFNGGCKEHCEQKVEEIKNEIKNEIKLIKISDQVDFEIKNSCLNKSLCRG